MNHVNKIFTDLENTQKTDLKSDPAKVEEIMNSCNEFIKKNTELITNINDINKKLNEITGNDINDISNDNLFKILKEVRDTVADDKGEYTFNTELISQYDSLYTKYIDLFPSMEKIVANYISDNTIRNKEYKDIKDELIKDPSVLTKFDEVERVNIKTNKLLSNSNSKFIDQYEGAVVKGKNINTINKNNTISIIKDKLGAAKTIFHNKPPKPPIKSFQKKDLITSIEKVLTLLGKTLPTKAPTQTSVPPVLNKFKINSPESDVNSQSSQPVKITPGRLGEDRMKLGLTFTKRGGGSRKKIKNKQKSHKKKYNVKYMTKRHSRKRSRHSKRRIRQRGGVFDAAQYNANLYGSNIAQQENHLLNGALYPNSEGISFATAQQGGTRRKRGGSLGFVGANIAPATLFATNMFYGKNRRQKTKRRKSNRRRR